MPFWFQKVMVFIYIHVYYLYDTVILVSVIEKEVLQ